MKFTPEEILEIEANIHHWQGKHWIENGIRYMLYRGVVFRFDPASDSYKINK